ncbi:MAG: hypothetical protein Q8O67_24910 [Deltaproteobacteria bacterium]|nr:hypothetical protein [Deltaproteobacteria bacterium]
MSIGVLLLAAVVALGLESTGAGHGGRKRVGRLPQVVVVVVAAVVAALLAPGPASVGVAGALVLFALIEGPALLGERAALALVLGAGTLKIGPTSSPAALLAWIALWAVVTAGLSMRVPSKELRPAGAEAEAATKAALLGMMAVMLAGLSLVDGQGGLGVGSAALLVAVALVLGVPPLQGIRVDVFQGAPPAAMAVSAPLALIALGPVLARLAAVQPLAAVDVAIGLGLFVLPLVALAQVSLRRLVGVLVAQQAVLPLVAGRIGADPVPATLAAALGAVALAVAVAALPVFSSPTATWEDASGWGRRHPWRAGLLLFAAAQACGLPPTLGFAVRQSLARAAHEPWLTVGVLLGVALAALPVVRLALFLFGKQPRKAEGPAPLPPGPVIGLVVVVAVAVVAGVLSP